MVQPSLAHFHVAVFKLRLRENLSVKPRYRRSAGGKGPFPTTPKAPGLSRSPGLQAER